MTGELCGLKWEDIDLDKGTAGMWSGCQSGCRDLNPGPLDPQSSALTKLRHSPYLLRGSFSPVLLPLISRSVTPVSYRDRENEGRDSVDPASPPVLSR